MLELSKYMHILFNGFHLDGFSGFNVFEALRQCLLLAQPLDVQTDLWKAPRYDFTGNIAFRNIILANKLVYSCVLYEMFYLWCILAKV